MKLGLIAGKGKLPLVFKKEVLKRKEDIVVIGINGVTDIDADYYLPIGKINKLIDILKKEKVVNLVMLGKFEQKIALNPSNFDIKSLSILLSLKDKRPVFLIKAFMKLLEEEGFTFINPITYLESLIIKEKGLINSVSLDDKTLKDIEFGIGIAKRIADLDIGQTIVVKDLMVVAIEGIEGTDNTIKRAFDLGVKDSSVIKSARSNQDFRIDVPVIGEETIETAHRSKVKALAFNTDKMFVIEKEKVFKLSQKYNISIYGF